MTSRPSRRPPAAAREEQAARSQPSPPPDPLVGEIDRLVAGEHENPHNVLGRHGPVIRARRPDALAMRVLLPDGSRAEMKQVHDGGVFEADVSGADQGYRLEADYAGGVVTDFDDPYRFWPTLGDLDLHLLGEGRHRRLWRVLGAHARVHQGDAGTSFAVWAPNARSVRVVGGFNQWDGRVNALRSLGSSGIWASFVPGV